MLTAKNLPLEISSPIPPIVLEGPSSKTRYAIIDGHWLACDMSVTTELLQSVWSRPKRKQEDKPSNNISVKVKSSSGKDYYIVEYMNDVWSCTCPAFGFRRKCKHIDQVKSKKH